MGTAPVFASVPILAAAVVDLNTDRTGVTGTYTVLYTAPANGARIERIRAKLQSALPTSTGVILFLNNGSNRFVVGEVPLQLTLSGEIPAENEWAAISVDEPLLLPSGWSVEATRLHAANVTVTVEGSEVA